MKNIILVTFITLIMAACSGEDANQEEVGVESDIGNPSNELVNNEITATTPTPIPPSAPPKKEPSESPSPSVTQVPSNPAVADPVTSPAPTVRPTVAPAPDVSAIESQQLPKDAVMWSDSSSWPEQKRPLDGDLVTIPEGQVMVLDTSTPALGGLMIHGKLIFADQVEPSLTSEWVMVMGEGSALEIGTEEAPYSGRTSITLIGTDEEKNVMQMGMGNKFITSISGGRIDIHGISAYKKSWTQLIEDAMPGATSLVLETATGWAVGDQIVIAPSSWLAEETEVVTIVEVDDNKVAFSPALQFKHLAHTSEYGGKFLDQRAEVGLLSRNILIQGAEDSLQSNYGGHLMVMPDSKARITGAEFYRMGQQGHKARYPIHWHLLGRASGDMESSGMGQYASHNSIRDSFQRAIVVHGTGGVLAEENVAYNVLNHSFVPSEDGDEIGNQFINNIAFLQRSPEPEDFAFKKEVANGTASTQGESRSAAFWFRNPNNTMEGNHAAGGIKANGFFFDLRHLTGEMIDFIDSTAEGIMPFKDNLAHSYMWRQKMFGQANGYPEVTKGHGFIANNTGASLKIFSDFTSYKNFSGVWIDGRQGKLVDSIVADNGSGLVFHRAQAEDVVIVGESEIHKAGDKKPVIGRWGPSGAVHIFDEHLKDGSPVLKNVTFINHPDRPAIFHTPTGIGADASLEGLTFINTPQRFYLKDYMSNIKYWNYSESAYLDKDGSLSASNEPAYITRRFSSLLKEGTGFDELTNTASFPLEDVFKVHIDDRKPVDYYVDINGQANDFVSGSYSKDRFLSKGWEYKNYGYFSAGGAYSLVWDLDNLPESNIKFYYTAAAEKDLEISFAYPQVTSINFTSGSSEAYASLSALQQGQSAGYFYDVANGHLYLKLMGTGKYEEFTVSSQGAWTNTSAPIKGRKSTVAANLQPGLEYRYYPNVDDIVQDMPLIPAQSSGIAYGFDTSARTMDDNYGFVYDGLLKVEQSGLHQFSVSAEGDIDFYIGGVYVTGERNGRVYKGLRRMKNGDFALEKGYHPIRVVYRQGKSKHELGILMNKPGDDDFDLLDENNLFHDQQ